MYVFLLDAFINLVSVINNYVDKEVNDANNLQQKLLESRLKYEMDEITEQEYEEIEKIVLNRINEIRQQKLDDAKDYN